MAKEFIFDQIIAERGLSITDIVNMTDIGRSTIDDIRRKKGVGSYKSIKKLADFLEIKTTDFYITVPDTEKSLGEYKQLKVDTEELKSVAR